VRVREAALGVPRRVYRSTLRRGGFIVTREDGKTGRRWSTYGRKEAANLLEALEALRLELGSVGEDIITIMRDAGITPPEDADPEKGSPLKG
jgi:hypothetical protein